MTVQMHAMMLLINDSLIFHVMRLFQLGEAMGKYCVCEGVSSAEFGTLRAWHFLHKGKFGCPALGQEISGLMYIQPLLLRMDEEPCGSGMPEILKSSLWT